jgi:hypothetical protein
VRLGLGLAALGHVLLLAVAVPGLLLAGQAPHAERLGWLPGWLPEDDAEWFGLVLAAAAAPLGYVLLLAGQWRCLRHAPQRDGAKEWMFVSLLCLLIMPVPFAVAHFIGGAANYAVFQRGLAAVDDLALGDVGGLLQLVGVVLVLLSCLLFAQFQRAARRCLPEGTSSRLAEGYFFFVFLLLGACAGPAVFSQPASRQLLLQILAVGWGLSGLWHLALILDTRRAIQATLRRLGLGTGNHRRPRIELLGSSKPVLNGTGPAGT